MPKAENRRLAEVIATRGGQAPPEAPFVIEHREALIYILCQAAELEHGIMAQYLFAAFSLKQSAAEGLTEKEAEAAQRWRKQISHVAAQEMLHLALVQNVLSAIGAAPHLTRPNFPQPANHYPAGVHLTLLPFGEQALRHFMFLERPEGMALDDAVGRTAYDLAEPGMLADDIVPQVQDFATVGHLYRSIEAGIAHLAEKYGADWLFVGPPRAQATTEHFSWPELVAVSDVASAQRAIDEILEQGEGPRGDWRDAHFGQFVAILDEFQELKNANPAFDPVRPVIAANVRPSERDPGCLLVTDPQTKRVMDIFNVCYEILLLAFQRFFAHTEETDAQLKVLADVTVALMVQVIKPLGDMITTLPAGPEYPSRTVGPSFELFYESDYLLPHRVAAWSILAERIEESAAFCESAGLLAIRDSLQDIARSLTAHIPGRQPQTPAAPEADLDSMQAEAAELCRTTLRPLAAALGQGEDEEPPTQTSDPVWDTALFATRLRVRLADEAPPELLEATAALQRMACHLASTPGQRANRIAELAHLQAGLPAKIEVAKNGPYLTTNVPAVRTHLGEPLEVPPQLALCRCGGSAMKPFCDGTHTGNGFNDDKDPGRVPDRRDTYPGQQATVFDNRGICQHSGLCTDRLAAAFRSGAEPFVAPSGGRLDEIIRVVRDCPSGALSLALDGEEARPLVDWHGQREAAIEISLDGPYRVTGGIPLADAAGGAAGGPGQSSTDVARAEGSSREHYALCRCGHSRNKPFCSGMHWYIEFHDPLPGSEPTLFEWAGGLPALTRMTRLLYEKLVPADDLLAPVFADVGPGHARREAMRMAEAFGGPASGAAAGGPGQSNAARPDRDLTEERQARWVALATRAADEARLPADAEFRAALAGYLDWESRAPAGSSTPTWDWGPAGPPAVTPSGPAETGEQAVALPEPGEAVSFEAHIKPLFRPRDQKSMAFAFDLWSYADVRANATGILDRLRNGTMPCDGAWPQEKVAAFERWTESDFKP